MNISEQLLEDMKTAMRAKDTTKLSVVRFLRSELKNAQIDAGDLDENGMLTIIAKQAKQMKDAVAEFEKAGRDDLVAEELDKIAIVESYLPQQLSDGELREHVMAALKTLDNPNMGSLIGAAKKRVGMAGDSRKIAQIAKELLT